MITSIVIILLGGIAGCFAFITLHNRVSRAAIFTDQLSSRFFSEPGNLADLLGVSDVSRSIPIDNDLGAAMRRFAKLLSKAVSGRLLLHFSIEENLAPVQRSARQATGFARPLAGWLLLIGLIVTLYNLQGAVSHLGTAFQNIRASSPTEQDQPTQENKIRVAEQSVTDSMSAMANTASRAFQYSFAFIVLALCSMVAANYLERRALNSILGFERWANDVFLYHLPAQLPLGQGDTAVLLKESIDGMKEVVTTMRVAAEHFQQLGPLLGTLDRSTAAIEFAMKDLPGHLKSSMSDITSDLVSGLTSTLGESAEYTKRILAIYTEQELRIKGIAGAMREIKSAIDAIQATHKLLDSLPAQQAIIAQAASGLAASSAALANTSEQMAGTLAKLPIADLQDASYAIQASSLPAEDMRSRLELVHTGLLQFIEDNKRSSKPIEELSRATSQLITLLETRITQSKAAYARSIQQHVIEALESHRNQGTIPPDIFTSLERQVRAIRFEKITFDGGENA